MHGTDLIVAGRRDLRDQAMTRYAEAERRARVRKESRKVLVATLLFIAALAAFLGGKS